MDKPTKPPGEIVPAPQVPAVPKRPNKWKMFQQLRSKLNEVVTLHDHLSQLSRELRYSSEPPSDVLSNLEYGETLTGYDRELIALCRQWLEEIDPADYYEEGDEKPILKKQVIAKRLFAMIEGVYVGGPKGDVGKEGFATMMLEHVYNAEISYPALEGACRQLEGQQNFVPTIAKVLKAAKKHEKRWARRKHALDAVERVAHMLEDQVPAAWVRYYAKQVREAEEKLRQCQDRACKAYENARKTYQSVEEAMEELAERQRLLDGRRKPRVVASLK